MTKILILEARAHEWIFTEVDTSNVSVPTTGCPVPSRLGFGIGWFDWKLPDGCSIGHFVMFQGDLERKPRWHENFLVYDFSSLQSHNFWNTISWKCSLKDDCIRSSLMECPSLLNRKININPKYRVLMFHPSIVEVLCSTWFTWSQSLQDLHDLCLLDQWARRILSVSCLNFDLQVSIHYWW